MPFKSKAQMGAAFGGYLGSEMKSKASEWAHETSNIKSLPNHVSKTGKSKHPTKRDHFVDHLNRKR